MASKVYVSEYTRMKIVEGSGTGQMPDEDSWIQDQVIDFSGGVANITLNGSTNFVRINTDSVCSILYGTAPVATNANQRWAANQTEYRGVTGGKKFSAITNT